MSNVSFEDISDEFDVFGEDVDDSQLQRLQEICQSYSIDANAVVNQWMAFSSSKKVELSLDSIEVFDREWLPKKLSISQKTPKTKGKSFLNKNTINSALEDQLDIIGSYATPEQKSQIAQNAKRQLTPENNNAKNKRFISANGSPALKTFSPTALSPAGVTPSAKFSSRSNSGETVLKFGNLNGQSWEGEGHGCDVVHFDPSSCLTSQMKYMFQKMMDKAGVLNEMIEELSQTLQNAHSIEEFGHLALPSQSQSLPKPDPPGEQENAKPLRMIVAVGPYAPSDGLDYSPLSDLIKVINRDKPDICVLMGPFVDTKNSTVNNGDLPDTFEELFNNQMEELGRATQRLGCKIVIVSSSRDAHSCYSVYPQPPYRISTHFSDGSKKSTNQLEMTKDLVFVSDPATLVVNGVVIGLTSTDILMHLTKSEISFGQQTSGLDRMGRLAQHILHQHNYYPLYPSSDDVNIDYDLWETAARLPVTPHILLLPSDLKAFAKDIEGCCCINPGRLTTGLVGGTFAQVVVDTLALRSSSSPAAACAVKIVKV
ncbi:DNA polymerase alpha subunit B [Elysia marginata]|uniref:DNA polymerase alpha subunit B n=1 Tax=Elysia marginata TaxID=1093978 RepID=A0AAV4HYI8_9GAST|nr:DNA polymerase alpha subunit B [Elysia marginata]